MEIKVFEVKLRVGFSFLAVTALIFLTGSKNESETYFSVCLIHEIIHGAVLCFCGEELESISLSGLGIKMLPKRKLFSVKKELAVLISAPLGNLILGIFFRKSLFGQINLLAGIFNLLPYSSLDGGSIIEAVIPEKRLIIQILRIIPPLVFAVLSMVSGRNFLPFFCVSALYFVADLDNSFLMCYYKEKKENRHGKGT